LFAARRFVNKASIKQMAFWTEIVEERPDLGRLNSLTTELNEAISQAERCFQELFAINSQSLSIIRLYASFNEYVCCNSEKAGVLLHEAERIEDQKTKDHNSEGANRVQIMSESSLEIMTDATAVLTIGGQVRNFGTIVTANNNTMRVFNFSRLHLERRNFFSLLAQPMASGGAHGSCARARAPFARAPARAARCARVRARAACLRTCPYERILSPRPLHEPLRTFRRRGTLRPCCGTTWRLARAASTRRMWCSASARAAR